MKPKEHQNKWYRKHLLTTLRDELIVIGCTTGRIIGTYKSKSNLPKENKP